MKIETMRKISGVLFVLSVVAVVFCALVVMLCISTGEYGLAMLNTVFLSINGFCVWFNLQRYNQLGGQ